MLLWVMEPVLYLGVFYIVSVALNLRGGVEAVPFLLIGLVVWKWFASSVYSGAVSIVKAAVLIQQIRVSKHVFLLASLLSEFYQFLIVFLFLVCFLLLYGIHPMWGWIELLLLILLQWLLIAAVAGIFASFIPFFQDLKVVVVNGLPLVFFLSGVFFDIDSVATPYRLILYLNPMAILIDAYRDVIFTGQIQAWTPLAWIGGVSLSGCILVALVLHRLDQEYPKVLSA